MEIVGFMNGTLGLVFALIALARVGNLEKKLKQFDVIPHGFDPDKKPQESGSDRDP